MWRHLHDFIVGEVFPETIVAGTYVPVKRDRSEPVMALGNAVCYVLCGHQEEFGDPGVRYTSIIGISLASSSHSFRNIN
jgi:hypothetical protein